MIQLLEARIFHERLKPSRNRFGYLALYCLFPLEMLEASCRRGLFSINRGNFFSVWSSDYGRPGVAPVRYIRELLSERRLTEADGEVRLMTMPRVLGYAFNPVSFWFCFDKDKRLRAVLAEVNNTFGERHSYLCFHDDHRVIAQCDMLSARKAFHVSPFMKVEGRYAFRFGATQHRIAVGIDLEDSGGMLLRTSVAGRPGTLTNSSLLSLLAKNPLYPLKVIGLIHYQAVKLFFKGIRHFNKPEPPQTSVTHGS
jgi:uncharacterized protein